jgi:hypothetical protein
LKINTFTLQTSICKISGEANLLPFEFASKHQNLSSMICYLAYPQLRQPRFIENWFLELLDNPLKYL